MNLPTQSQVLAATRNVASFAAGAIAMFGLGSKIDPQTVVALINSLGTLTNDAITVIGIATPLIAAWYASHSASPDAQKKAVSLQPNTVVVNTDTPAATASAIAAIPQVKQVVTTPEIAKAAGPIGDGAKVVSKS